MLLLFAGQSRLLPCTTSPDPDLSQSVSDSQQHTVVADLRGGAHSGIKLHCISSATTKKKKKKKSEKRGAHPTISRVTTTSPAWCAALSGWPCRRQGGPGTYGTRTGTVAADYLLGAVSVLQTEETGDISPEELSKCWKLPSAASIEDLPPTLPLIHNPGRGGESPAAAAVDGETKALDG